MFDKYQYQNEYEQIIAETQKLLDNNPEWQTRYHDYIDIINQNKDKIKDAFDSFGKVKCLKVYLPVSKAIKVTENSVDYDIRYDGQSVATLSVKNCDCISLTLCKTNARDFYGYPNNLLPQKYDWTSSEAVEFRKYFSSSPKRAQNSPIQNAEHKFESMLLGDFAKNSSTDKILTGIQPILLSGCRFQMPTPLKASNAKNNEVKYSGPYGGGIDILARIGHGKGTHLSVLELKDESISSEPPEKAIKQAIAYATFIRTLLRTDKADPQKWWELFGFSNNIPTPLKINAVVVMPIGNFNETGFAKMQIPFNDAIGDYIELHYIYFDEQLLLPAVTSL